MSQITTTKTNAAKAGRATSAATANAIYTDLATSSAAIDNTNTRTESISRRHLRDLYEAPTGEHPTFHQLETVFQDAVSLAYNNTVFADITHGGACSITFPVAITLKTGEALRMQANINMKAVTKGVDGGGTLAITNDRYYYSFWGTIGGVLTQLSPSYGYSLTQNSGATNSTFINRNDSFSDKIQFDFIADQKEAFSYCYFNKAAPDKVITDCRVRFRVDVPPTGSTANTITLKEFRLVAVGAR